MASDVAILGKFTTRFLTARHPLNHDWCTCRMVRVAVKQTKMSFGEGEEDANDAIEEKAATEFVDRMEGANWQIRCVCRVCDSQSERGGRKELVQLRCVCVVCDSQFIRRDTKGIGALQEECESHSTVHLSCARFATGYHTTVISVHATLE